MDSLYILIPAYNEEENIKAVIDAWYPLLFDKGPQSRMVINTSGSRDNTTLIIKEMMESHPLLEVMEDSENTYGDKVLDLYRFAAERSPDYVFQTDSDGQTSPDDFAVFWQNRKDFDAQIGNRKRRGDGRLRLFVEKTVCVLIAVLCKVRIPDANTPFRLMKTDYLKKAIEEIPGDYSMPNIMLSIHGALGKADICFKEINFGSRQFGKNTMNYKKICTTGIESLRQFREFANKMKRGGYR